MSDAWEKFTDGARVVVNSVAEAAGEIYEKGKDYVSVKRLESRLRDAYRRLGRLQYLAETGGKFDGAEKAALITEIGELIKGLTKNEAGDGSSAVCKSCGAPVAAGANFCQNCGAAVAGGGE